MTKFQILQYDTLLGHYSSTTFCVAEPQNRRKLSHNCFVFGLQAFRDGYAGAPQDPEKSWVGGEKPVGGLEK